MLTGIGNWQIVNDGVMGGLSNSRVREENGGLVFSGSLSLANNGGFASIRTRLEHSLAGATGFRLVVRGDGRRYQFRLRRDERADRAAWRYCFDTDGGEQSIRIRLEDFEPVFRGRVLEGADPPDAASIRVLGFMTADKREGPFELVVRAIEPVFTGFMDRYGESDETI